MTDMEDPVIPTVTFDSYVRPETVRQKAHVRALVQARYQAIMRQRAEAAAAKPVVVESAAPGHTARSRLMQVFSEWQGHAAQLRVPQNARFAAVAVIGVLTFALGITATLTLVGPARVADVARTDPQEVTRQQSPDLMSTAAVQPRETPTGLTAPEPAAAPRAALADSAEKPEVWLASDVLVNLRDSVRDGRYRIAPAPTGDIRRLALVPDDADLARTATAGLAEVTATAGDDPVLRSFRTPEGQIDTDTVLFSLIQTSLLRDATPESDSAAREMSRRVFAASDATTQRINGQRTYEVRPGDSLAYIAMQFYGRPDAYPRILTANGEAMSSPDEIRTGQRLIIPTE